MTTLGLVDVGEPAQGDHDVEAVTVAEDAGHGDRSGERFEVLGGRFVGHVLECDEGVSRLVRSPPLRLPDSPSQFCQPHRHGVR